MHTVKGSCYCENISFTMMLSRPLESYAPRACDCDFCSKHGATYVSDAQGHLDILTKEQGQVRHIRHGSQSAEFVICQTCGVLVYVYFEATGVVYGAVNSRCVLDDPGFGDTMAISPKALEKEAKTARWQDIWFSHVVRN